MLDTGKLLNIKIGTPTAAAYGHQAAPQYIGPHASALASPACPASIVGQALEVQIKSV